MTRKLEPERHAHSVQKHISFRHLGQFRLTSTSSEVSHVNDRVGGETHDARVSRVVRWLRDEHDVGILASPAFELARIVYGELVVFSRQEPSPGHRVQFVVVYKYCHVVVYMKGRVKMNAPSTPKGILLKAAD